MIAVRLMGGLGNQMFQYALGRRLATQHRVALKLDLSWFDCGQQETVDTPRHFALQGWRIEAQPATADEISQFPVDGKGRIGRLLSLLSPRGKGAVVRERGFAFQESVLQVPPPALFIGYWQSEKYFAAIEQVLRNEFTLVQPACEHVAGVMDRLGANAISLHIRRGDYVNNPTTHAFHGVCPIEYYEEACRLMAERVPDPHFVIFSDEPDWARDNLTLQWRTTVMAHSRDCRPHDDIFLMSRCAHHIIANSSFSWWGAWLGGNPDKIVVAPKAWFKGAEEPADLIPDRWIRL